MSEGESKRLANAVGLEELPINPKTGLHEAWVFEALTLATMIGGSLYKGALGRQSAKNQLNLIGEQQGNISESREKASEAKSTKMASIKQDATVKLGQESDRTGIDKTDLLAGYTNALEKSGMAYSGDVEQKKSEMWKRIVSGFEHTKENLIASLGKAYGEAEGWFEGEMGRLDADQVVLDFKKKQYEQQQTQVFG